MHESRPYLLATIAFKEMPVSRSAFAASLATAALLMSAGVAQAAPADDARAHFQAIAAGDVNALMRGYADSATFQWVGGPLDGAYSSTDAIRGLWGKFTGGQGAMKLNVGAVEESTNPKGSTVSANVMFEGKTSIKVRYVLTFREGKIVNEIWQINPKLTVAAAQ